jgi:hypothetical protein
VTAADLLEEGIRAYARGALDEAERCWERALVTDPKSDRARSYLAVLAAKRRDTPVPAGRPVALPAPSERAAASGDARAVPLPAPAAQRATPRQTGTAPGGAPVSLPGRPITNPGWMRSPVTIVPDPPPGFGGRPAPPTKPTLPQWSSDDATGAAPLAAHDAQLSPPPARAAAPAAQPAPPRRASAAPPRREEVPPLPAAPEQTRTDRISVADYVPSPWDEGPALAPAVVVQDGDGLDLATVEEQSGLRPLVPESPPSSAKPPARPRSDIEVWMEGARELFALGDFSGSLEMIEKILKLDPNHTEARLYLEQNEQTLTAMYESKLGPQDAIPRLAIGPEEVMWLNLDHRAGFLLAQIDGTITYEDLFALSGLPRLDTARILATLLQEGVITA